MVPIVFTRLAVHAALNWLTVVLTIKLHNGPVRLTSECIVRLLWPTCRLYGLRPLLVMVMNARDRNVELNLNVRSVVPRFVVLLLNANMTCESNVRLGMPSGLISRIVFSELLVISCCMTPVRLVLNVAL